jgi:hypothetical protein
MINAGAVLLESSDINVRGAGLGLFGGLLFTVVVVSVILLLRNMNMRIRRLPENFDEPASAASPESPPPTPSTSPEGESDAGSGDRV